MEQSGLSIMQASNMCRPRHFLSNWNHYHYDRYRQPKKKGSDCFMRLGSWTYAEILTCLVIFLLCNISLANTSCGRSIIAKKHGIISDGPGVYLRKRSCEWLIKAPSENQTLKLTINKQSIECNYDYLYIFDGDSYSAPLLASISGFDVPDFLLSSSSKVLVVLQTDYHLEKDGFELTFEAMDCPNNCSGFGTCVNGICTSCPASRKGIFCEEEWCPMQCNSLHGKGNCNAGSQKCHCKSGFVGESCSLPSAPNVELNSWHTLSSRSAHFKPRSGHVTGYFSSSDTLIVYGGRSLNEVHDDTLQYNISSNTWRNIHTSSKPPARFQHAGDIYNNYLVIFGGETANGTILNDMWLFNTVSLAWSQPVNHSFSSPPGLVGHTANIVEDTLYVFGGITDASKFSTSIYAFNFKTLNGWRSLAALGGKPELFRFYGHSSVYSKETKSLLYFGGERAHSVGQNSAKQRMLVSFSLEHLVWAEIAPDQSSKHSLPFPMVFHTAVIAGEYMVVYGGVIEVPDGNKCYSNDFYYYNIKCNTWVSASHINSTSSPPLINYPPRAGRFSHTAVMRDHQTMIIIAGFNGVMYGDILAYRFPQAVVLKNSNNLVETGGHCNAFQEKNPCYADPACGWCFSTPLICLPLANASSCQGEFDGRYCTSRCSAYSSCETCLTLGNFTYHGCSWCVHDQRCYDTSSPGGACSPSKSVDYQGWWGKGSKLLSNIAQCFSDDLPPGVTQVKYTVPSSIAFPDSVNVVKELKFAEAEWLPSHENIKLFGSVYPYIFESNPLLSKPRKVLLSGNTLSARLFISTNQYFSSKEEVAVLPFLVPPRTIVAKPKSSSRLFPSPSKDAGYFLQCELNTTARTVHKQLLIEWNLTSVSNEVIGSSYLRPYYNGSCSFHVTCLACIVDSACGWCSESSSCIQKSEWSTCKTADSRISLIKMTQSLCFKCSDIYDCITCSQNPLCSWSSTSNVCLRKKLQANGVTNSSLCPTQCNTRRSCSSCLSDHSCRWCYEKQECFTPSTHMSKYPHGQCQIYQIKNLEKCRNCSAHKTCASCLANHRCGWCGTVDNPLIGRCYDGDFAGPVNRNCSAIMQTNRTVSWSYDWCPDADECRLKVDDCHGNASCINTYGSYKCICNRGYTGDGKLKCDRTCYHNCQNGYCAEDYQCKCDLGWKGENCSIDCGCSGHSTCTRGVGICDACQNHTKGKYCDECAIGAFGDPRQPIGCKPCECNGHGISELGLCHNVTGKCFCKDQTHGDNCGFCTAPLVGNARNGGICFYECQRLSVLKNATYGYLSKENKDRKNCLWVITYSNASDREILLNGKGFSNATTITLTTTFLNFSCIDSHLNIYDGSPLRDHSNLIGSICGYDAKKTKSLEARSGVMTVQYEGLTSSGTFHILFKVNHCNFSCTDNRHCVQGLVGGPRCICKPGWMGAECKELYCPGNCSYSNSKGYCNQITGKCICQDGFLGLNCSQPFMPNRLNIEDWSCRDVNIEPRFGQTFLAVEKLAVLYGGRGLGYAVFSNVLSIDLKNQSCQKIGSKNQPPGRYYHCAVIFQGKMLVYGGLTKTGASNQMYSYHFHNQTWTSIPLRSAKPNTDLPFLYSHTCTLVGDVVYVIGGFDKTKDGLNEHILGINMTSLIWERLNVPTVVKGIYGHSAVYDESTKNILVFGGIVFSQEYVHESNALYAFNIMKLNWNLLQPHGQKIPFLYQHSAVLINDTMVIIGGYSDASKKGYNKDLLLWKKSCNQWQSISLQNDQPVGVEYHPGVGQSAIVVDSAMYTFGGFNTLAFNSIQKLTLPVDTCSFLTEKGSCLALIGCDWCENQNLSSNGLCYDVDKAPAHTCSNLSSNSTLRCSNTVLEKRDCRTLLSCSSCFATFPGTSKSHCRWCMLEGCRQSLYNCIYISPAVQIQCLDYKCEASSCEECTYDIDCMWTRYFKYKSERSRGYDPNRAYDWNCFRKYIQANGKYPANDTDKCPALCSSYKTCQSCVASTGAEGGSTKCYWSQQLGMCFSPSFQYIRCHPGDCGVVLKDDASCPANCSTRDSCSSCIQSNGCGWCAEPGHMGLGGCMDGDHMGPRFSVGCSQNITKGKNATSFWASMICPSENECLNGKHNCDLNQRCVDTVDSFLCLCKDGYGVVKGSCVPICSQGCVKGACVQPEVCKCDFGWTSTNCSVQCQCNGHSNCPNEKEPNICIECYNNTQGKSCNECKASFVGDPTKGFLCTPCSYYCHGRATVCVPSSSESSIPDNVKRNLTMLLDYVGKGPTDSGQIACVNCQGNSEGAKCEKCKDGYFNDNLNCRKCQCNGHSLKCSKDSGGGCLCDHSTKSEGSLWSQQCNQCKEGFIGSPKDGRQCFKRMSNEAALMIGSEKVHFGRASTIVGLPPNRTMFVAIPPRFTNVDIRLNADVIQGSIDIYISTNNQDFVVDVNYASGDHYLVLPQGQSHNISRRSVHDEDLDSASDLTSEDRSRKMYRRSVAISNTPNTTKLAALLNVVHVPQSDLSMYTEFKAGLLHIKGIQQRVIVGIKHSYFDFRKERFFIGIVTRGNSKSLTTAGYVYFRQDLSQIDLFVFFSVFFSVFFLILSFFFLTWKIKQVYYGRQAVLQQQIALESMASRPFAQYTVQCERNDSIPVYAKTHSKLVEPFSNRNRRNSRRRHKTIFPMAVEVTDDEMAAVVTIFIQFPENEESLWNFSLGSAIVQSNPQQIVHTISNGRDSSKMTTRFSTTVST